MEVNLLACLYLKEKDLYSLEVIFIGIVCLCKDKEILNGSQIYRHFTSIKGFRADVNGNQLQWNCLFQQNTERKTTLFRCQFDKTSNFQGQLLTTICKTYTCRFSIQNGIFLCDFQGYFTFYNLNGLSTVNYMLYTTKLNIS